MISFEEINTFLKSTTEYSFITCNIMVLNTKTWKWRKPKEIRAVLATTTMKDADRTDFPAEDIVKFMSKDLVIREIASFHPGFKTGDKGIITLRNHLRNLFVNDRGTKILFEKKRKKRKSSGMTVNFLSL